jgi:multidrug efflux pump subunit AcrA (membrane-fusion protein)
VARAAVAGRIEPAVAVGDPVMKDQPLGRVVDVRSLRGTVAVSPSQAARVTQGMPLTLHLSHDGASPVRTQVAKVADTPGAGGLWHAELEVDNPGQALPAPLSGVAEIHCDRSPLLSHLLAVVGL